MSAMRICGNESDLGVCMSDPGHSGPHWFKETEVWRLRRRCERSEALIVEWYLAYEATGTEWDEADSAGRDAIEERMTAASDALYDYAREVVAAALPSLEGERE